jgi:UDP-glucose 4-epimerase
MIVLIGYGFLGSAIYSALKNEGLTVKVIARTFVDSENTDFIKAEINEVSNLIGGLNDVKTIIHCVHTTVPSTSMDNQVFDVESNIVAFINLMNSCKNKGIHNFIYISSGGAVYGVPAANALVDESFPTNPISSYGITKLACEKYLLINKNNFNGNCIILRPSNIYGMGQKTNKPQGIIGHINEAALNGKSVEIWGTGNSQKDYLCINDFVDGVLKVVKCDKLITKNVFNISSGNLYSLNYLIKAFEKKYQKKIEIENKPEKKFDVTNIAISNKLFCETFNWKNSTSFENFLEQL